MALCKHRLPGFRGTLVGVGSAQVLLGGSILARGVRESMAPFGVPEEALASPYFGDAIWWVYTHMVVIGLMMIVVGLMAEGERFKRWMVRILLGAHIYYGYLDFSASDSPLGNALYKGPASLLPAIIVTLFTLLLAHVALCHRGQE